MIRQSPVSVEELAARAGRPSCPGSARPCRRRSSTLVETGEIPSAAKLKAKFPATLVEVTRVPGLGAKTARRLLRRARRSRASTTCASRGRGRADPRRSRGSGPKVGGERARALEQARRGGPAPGACCSRGAAGRRGAGGGAARRCPAADPVEVAGSARRMAETCKDIDLIATATDPAALAEALTEHPLVAARRARPRASGSRDRPTTGSRSTCGSSPPEAYGNLLQHFTGSAEHNVELRERARRRGPLGLRARDHRRPRPARSSVRDRGGGLRAARARLHRAGAARGRAARSPRRRRASCPSLVEVGDIRGDLHCHTTLSDGRNTLEEMAEAARDARLRLPGGHRPLGQPRLRRPRHRRRSCARGSRRSRELQRGPKGKRFRLLAGSEVNIGPDGSLDYTDELLEPARLGDRERPHLVPDLARRR